MQIPLENRLGFYIDIDQGLQKGHSIAGGAFVMNIALPEQVPDEWHNFIESHVPLFGTYALCGRPQTPINIKGSVAAILKNLAENLYVHANCSKLRITLINHQGPCCISIVVQQTTFGVTHHFN